jgi:uncharacterized protein (DUF433 family)
MQPLKSYVRADEHGVMRVGNSRVMLDSVVASFEQGYSPETIQQQYPALSLEEVYGAITWYLANADEVARYLERQNALWAQWRAKAAAHPGPVVQRLRAVREQKSPEVP